MSLIKKLAITAIAATTLFSAGSTNAGSHIYEYIYYATSAKVTIVGGSLTRCDNTTFTWGTVTSHKRLTGKEPCYNF